MSNKEPDDRLDEGPFQRLFGNSAVTKVLDFLATHEDFDYSINEIAENTGIHRRTVSRVIPSLEYYQVVKNVRKIDRSNMYKLNKESKLSTLLRRLAYGIAEHDVDDYMAKEMGSSIETATKKDLITVSD